MANAEDVIAAHGTVELVPLPKKVKVGREVAARVHGTDRPAVIVQMDGDSLELSYQVGSNTYRAKLPRSEVFDVKVVRASDNSDQGPE